MKRTILRYGIYSSIVIIALFLLSFILFGGYGNKYQEVFGYASMIVSLLFVFFGIKHYRDRENAGALSFGQGMKVGILIVLIPSVLFGLFDLIYIVFINPHFVENYYQAMLKEMQQTLSPEKFAVEKANMESMKSMFSNPAFNFFVMFLTVFLIGLIITVISSLVLRRNVRSVVE